MHGKQQEGMVIYSQTRFSLRSKITFHPAGIKKNRSELSGLQI